MRLYQDYIQEIIMKPLLIAGKWNNFIALKTFSLYRKKNAHN